ncbi:MAG: dehydrogenase, partial [Chloroflexi bacterium]|nr:dehydrogenase [Chloroflexota bacterium]
GGEGEDVGPDLSKIGEKYGRDALFEAVLNPSAGIAEQYQVWIIRSESLGYVYGYIREESDDAVELVDSAGDTLRVRKRDIIERRKSEISLMPTGLSTGMTARELVDLVGYLPTLK